MCGGLGWYPKDKANEKLSSQAPSGQCWPLPPALFFFHGRLQTINHAVDLNLEFFFMILYLILLCATDIISLVTQHKRTHVE